MKEISCLAQLSGWILPDGRFVEAAEWWHLHALFELRDAGDACLTAPTLLTALKNGDEDAVKREAARCGFLKCSKHGIDGLAFSDAQLLTLQNLFQVCFPEEEIPLLHTETGAVRRISVQRLLQLRRAKNLVF